MCEMNFVGFVGVVVGSLPLICHVAFLPLFEEISTLMQLVQSRNAYVCDFVERVNRI